MMPSDYNSIIKFGEFQLKNDKKKNRYFKK